MTKSRNAAGYALTLGALGVVFGDIGTSPLYALHALFGPYGLHLPITPGNVYGVISMVIWAITLIVSVKYICFVMRAGNKGEGGIMALVTLIKNDRSPVYRRWLFIFLGLAGMALFYGDGTITPAISVLSAVEGLKVVSPGLAFWVTPVTLTLLAILFWIQQYGTGAIGKLFGPVMLAWFTVIGLAGGWQIWLHPEAAQAVSPVLALQFAVSQPLLAFAALGAVILAVTGAETLYADMGHFGRLPIARAWFVVVFPALVLCYIGQGAVILDRPLSGQSPFMALFPPVLIVPVVVLATAATLIASQSVISGAFSLTRQAIQLGFLPKMRVVHTSVREAGQIYIPFINILMFLVVVMLVVSFGSSARLAHAYGIAVSCTLAVDTILFLVVARQLWHKSRVYIGLAAAVFVSLDLLFVAANLSKIKYGGWVPITLSVLILLVVHTWLRGQAIVRAERRALEGPLQAFIDKVRAAKPPIQRVPGCAVYIGHHADLAPLALHAAVEKLHELHQRVIIVTVRISDAAHVPEDQRAVFSSLAYNDGISQLRLTYGFHDSPNVPKTLKALRKLDPELDFDADEASYFISLSKVVPGPRRNLAAWRKHLYTMMARNSLSTSDYYKLPIERTIEMRSLIEL